jgi:hypothetical protein
LELAGLMLTNQQLASSFVTSYVESDIISHPCHGEGWKIYEGYKIALEKRLGRKFELLTPIFFIDEYKKHRFRSGKVWGIYFTLGNLPAHLLNSTQYKYLLCLVPSTADLDLAVRQVIVAR